MTLPAILHAAGFTVNSNVGGRDGTDVVDHIIPLSEGGRDDPSNMQWQTKEEAKAKDKTEGKH